MSDEKMTTVVQAVVTGPMVNAEVIRGAQLHETASGVPPVRTVATTLTTGIVSIRYVPRPIHSGDSSDTGARAGS